MFMLVWGTSVLMSQLSSSSVDPTVLANHKQMTNLMCNGLRRYLKRCSF